MSGHTYLTGVAELKRCGGSQFDPQLVEVFKAVMSAES